MSSPVIDAFLTYQFTKRLLTPFEKWDAYKLGIIDENGKVLRKRSTLTKQPERDAWGYFDRMVCNLKKIIAKAPGGATLLGSAVAAALLVKEHKEQTNQYEDEVLLEQHFNECMQVLQEEAAVNNAGGGNVAGIGVGAQGEPGVPAKLTRMMKRKKPNVDLKVST